MPCFCLKAIDYVSIYLCAKSNSTNSNIFCRDVSKSRKGIKLLVSYEDILQKRKRKQNSRDIKCKKKTKKYPLTIFFHFGYCDADSNSI